MMRRSTNAIVLSSFVVCLVLFADVGRSQTGISSDGREYYLGVVYPSLIRQGSWRGDFVAKYTSTIYVSSSVDNSVDVTYFDDGGSPINGMTLTIKAGTSAQLTPDLSALRISDSVGEHVLYGTCHLSARAPINVQFVSTGTGAGGSYLALPMSCWGKKYVVQSYNDNPTAQGGLVNTYGSRGFFQVIAGFDGTQVSVTPATTTFGGHAGALNGPGSNGSPQPFTLSMNHGQMITIYGADADGAFDLTGSVVSANKPVAVIGGHENAFTAGSDDDAQFNDRRDYMVEQLIPTEAWDSTGMFTIPFLDSYPLTVPGFGDEVRVVALPANGNAVQYSDGTATAGLSVPSYSSSSLGVVQVPIGLKDVQGKPFGVMQYELSMQGTKPPYPSPSMLSIIPKSRWKSEYQFCAQTTKNQVHGLYLFIVAPRADWNNQKILVSHEGSQPSSLLSAGFGIKRTWNSLPGDTSVVGVVLVANGSGSYHLFDAATSEDPRYHGTFGAAVVSQVLEGFFWQGPAVYPDQPYEYANPLGMQFAQFGLPPSRLGATVTDHCGRWSVCIRDTGVEGSGIRYVELLNYTDNSLVSKLPVSHNVAFDPSVDPLGKGEIILSGTDTAYCFDVTPVNAADSAIGVVRVFDNSGSSILINLSATTKIAAASSGGLVQLTANSFSYGIHSVDSEICGILTVSNPKVSGGKDFQIDSIHVSGDKGHFRINGSLGPFPMTLAQGSSMQIPVCFAPDDTATFRGAVSLYSDCGQSFSFVLRGVGASPILRADDVTFDPTDSADTKCDTIVLRNTGTLPLVIGAGSALSDPVNFSFAESFRSQLPLTIAPGGRAIATVCFSPKDRNSHTATIEWQTNMRSSAALESHAKLISHLNGQGYNPGIDFTPPVLTFLADSTAPTVSIKKRIYLANRGASKTIDINAVDLAGADSAEFSISDEEFGRLSDFSLHPGDSTWFEITFAPDLSKPYPDRFATRTAELDCHFAIENSGVNNSLVLAPLSATFTGPDAVLSSGEAQGVFDAYIDGHSLVVRRNGAAHVPESCTIYDLLGRVVARCSRGDLRLVRDGIAVFELGTLTRGVYIVNITLERYTQNTLVQQWQ